LAHEVLGSLLAWLDARPQGAAIFDATNSTAERRRSVRERILAHDPDYVVIFVESFCNDSEVVEANIRMKLAKSPDYAGVVYEDARADFLARIANYERVYETLDDTGMKESELSYIKMINLSSHLVAHRVYGLVATSLLPYLMALHISARPVWLVRVGEAEPQQGGEAPSPRHNADRALSERGEVYATRLAAHFAQLPECRNARVLVCSHRRALEMASLIDHEGRRTSVRPFLNPMDRGAYEGVRRQDFAEKTEREFQESFARDPINTRFPGGESYSDFVRRVLPVLVEVEQQVEPVIVIAALSTLQLLSCYFETTDVREACDYEIPAHTAVEWRPEGGSFVKRVVPIESFPEVASHPGASDGKAQVAKKKRRLPAGTMMFQNASLKGIL